MLILDCRDGESVIFFDSDGRQTRATVRITRRRGRVRLCIDGPAKVRRAEIEERRAGRRGGKSGG